jgi:hypothetical protein
MMRSCRAVRARCVVSNKFMRINPSCPAKASGKRGEEKKRLLHEAARRALLALVGAPQSWGNVRGVRGVWRGILWQSVSREVAHDVKGVVERVLDII